MRTSIDLRNKISEGSDVNPKLDALVHDVYIIRTGDLPVRGVEVAKRKAEGHELDKTDESRASNQL